MKKVGDFRLIIDAIQADRIEGHLFPPAGLPGEWSDGCQKENLVSVDPKAPVVGLTEPVLVKQTQPSYTERVRDARVEGHMLFKMTIRKDGSLDCFHVKSLGFGLDESTIQEWPKIGSFARPPKTARGLIR